MAETTYDRTKAPKRFTAAVSRGLRESAVLAILALALVTLISLLTYHREDPAFSSTGGGDQDVGNGIGHFGALLSDILFFLFGRPAYLFPIMLGVACFVMFRQRDDEEGRTRANTAVRIGGFTLMLFASCGLATLHWSAGELRQTAGGVVGQFVGSGLAANLNYLGATLFMLAAWMAGVSLAFGVSWLTIVDKIGLAFWSGVGWLRARRSVARDVAVGVEAKKARVEAAKVEVQRSATRVKPRIEAPPATVEKSERAEKERQVPLFDAPKSGELPALKLLDDPPVHEAHYSQEALEAMSRLVELKLKDFGVEVEVVAVQPGPVVTRYEMRPAPGVKVSQISGLAKDLARSLSAISVRVVEVIPGKSVMGLEIPNEKREIVTLGEIIKSKAYDDVVSPLAIALGKDIGGAPVCADLAKMPHLLIAGTTGSGKSVAINAMILSLLYRLPPDQCKFIMIDPKVIELSVYEDIPHLLSPVVTEPHKAIVALKWVVREMDERYRLMSQLGVRDVFAFNRRLGEAIEKGERLSRRVQSGFEPGTGVPVFEEQAIEMVRLPLIVVVVDEVADLMLTAGKEIEAAIQRLSQKARAAGIHLIVATQRPSVDVLTGVIKANLPSRISFRVSSKIDSRTILGEQGAEQLLGQGDLLFMMPGERITRIHGPLVTDEEVERVATYLRGQGEPDYVDSVTDESALDAEGGALGLPLGEADNGEDAQYAQALQIVAQEGKASTSYLQRKMRIGYNSAARLIERMEVDGHVSRPDHVGRRQVLIGGAPDEAARDQKW
jgi:S-DNA-T family DNA segregation ATPase FtsK/SpoIIIE